MCCTHRWNSEDFIWTVSVINIDLVCADGTEHVTQTPVTTHRLVNTPIQQANCKITRNDLICLTVTHINLLQSLPPPSTTDTDDVSRAGGSTQLLHSSKCTDDTFHSGLIYWLFDCLAKSEKCSVNDPESKVTLVKKWFKSWVSFFILNPLLI